MPDWFVSALSTAHLSRLFQNEQGQFRVIDTYEYQGQYVRGEQYDYGVHNRKPLVTVGTRFMYNACYVVVFFFYAVFNHGRYRHQRSKQPDQRDHPQYFSYTPLIFTSLCYGFMAFERDPDKGVDGAGDAQNREGVNELAQELSWKRTQFFSTSLEHMLLNKAQGLQ